MRATRYVTPLREGGSLPGIVEADDLGIYVCKFRGAGQGLRVLVAEVVVAGRRPAGRRAGPGPGDVSTWPPRSAATRPTRRSRTCSTPAWDSTSASTCCRAPSATTRRYEPARDLAGRILWLDALCANVDRSWRNPNLLVWRGDLFAIDHGAALYFHHAWPGGSRSPERFAAQPYDVSEHIMRHYAAEAAAQDEELASRITAAALEDVLAEVPDDWLEPRAGRGVTRRAAAALRRLPARPGGRTACLAPRRGGAERVNGYQYVALRCVPRVDREEFVNVGVVLYCQAEDFLGSASLVDEDRLRALDPGSTSTRSGTHWRRSSRSAAVRRTSTSASAPARRRTACATAATTRARRFGFLRAPRSTVVQPGPVHGGLTDDPAAELQRLLEALVS